MVADEEQTDRSQEIDEHASRSLGIARFRGTDDQVLIAVWVVDERVLDSKFVGIVSENAPIDLAISEVPFVDAADSILLENVVHFWLLMYGEQLPIRIDATTARSQDDFATWMLLNELRDVVHPVLVDDPFSFGIASVLDHFGKAYLVGT